MLEAARLAAERAYCEYSKFPVGAALLTDDERIFEGCNIENASYGLTICAERVAVFNAISAGAHHVRRIAIVCPKGDPSRRNTLMPCGACRQVLAEFASPDLIVLIGDVGRIPFSELLPQPFEL